MKGVRRTGFRQDRDHPEYTSAVSDIPSLRVGPHPALGAFTCAFGLLLMYFGGMQLFGGGGAEGENLEVARLWMMMGLGALVWLGGSAVLARSVGLHPVVGVLLGLLLVPGLVILWILGRERRRKLAREFTTGSPDRPAPRNIRPLY